MKKLICLLAITLSCCNPAYSAKIERVPTEKKTMEVNKKPMKHSEKQQARKQLQSGKKKCYQAVDRKTKKKYTICERAS